jgi:hypothetical protein
LDQLERRYCKDTPFFRPFYIGVAKGPFLPGLNVYNFNTFIKKENKTKKDYKKEYKKEYK